MISAPRSPPVQLSAAARIDLEAADFSYGQTLTDDDLPYLDFACGEALGAVLIFQRPIDRLPISPRGALQGEYDAHALRSRPPRDLVGETVLRGRGGKRVLQLALGNSKTGVGRFLPIQGGGHVYPRHLQDCR